MKIDCQLCGRKDLKIAVDGATQGGPWAWMCEACHKVHGVGLGLGRGQKFDTASGKRA